MTLADQLDKERPTDRPTRSRDKDVHSALAELQTVSQIQLAQGGDWGAFVVDYMGIQAPRGLLAIHTNMPGTVPAEIDKAAQDGSPPPGEEPQLFAAELRAAFKSVR